jgi:hypothetical protein
MRAGGRVAGDAGGVDDVRVVVAGAGVASGSGGGGAGGVPQAFDDGAGGVDADPNGFVSGFDKAMGLGTDKDGMVEEGMFGDSALGLVNHAEFALRGSEGHGFYGGGTGYLAATAAISTFAPILTVFLGRQSREGWSEPNTWAAVIFAAAATVIKLALDMKRWDINVDRNKKHAFTYGTLYSTSIVFLIVAGFLIVASTS